MEVRGRQKLIKTVVHGWLIGCYKRTSVQCFPDLRQRYAAYGHERVIVRLLLEVMAEIGIRIPRSRYTTY